MTSYNTQEVTKQQPFLHCSYDFMYEPIYAPSYSISFVFCDEDEYEEESIYEENDFCSRPLH